jgi:hypothetical protein
MLTKMSLGHILCVFIVWTGRWGGEWLKEKRVGRCELWHAHRKQQKSHTPCVYIYVKNEKKSFLGQKKKKWESSQSVETHDPLWVPLVFVLIFSAFASASAHTHHLMIFFVWHQKKRTNSTRRNGIHVCVCVYCGFRKDTLGIVVCVHKYTGLHYTTLVVLGLSLFFYDFLLFLFVVCCCHTHTQN